MEVHEILKKLSICNSCIKDRPFGVSKTNFYKVKTFFIYNLLANRMIADELKIIVKNEKRGNEKFYSFCFEFETESIKLHQYQKDIPLKFIKHLLTDDTFYEFSQKDSENSGYDNDQLKEFVKDIVNFSKDLALVFNYTIFRWNKHKYSLYLGSNFMFNRDKISKIKKILFNKHPINTCSLIVRHKNDYIINRVAGVDTNKL